MDTSSDTADSYDRIAGDYAARIAGELVDKPFDRKILDRFADLVRPLGAVCDLGCGPGHVGRYLHERGLPVIGVDVSAGMLTEARRLNPEIRFYEGTMLDLNMDDASLGGIIAFYSIIHIPPPDLPIAFDEMQRVLRPQGRLLVAFHRGDEQTHVDELWGNPVSLDAWYYPRDHIERDLKAVGFEIEESLERPPYPEVEYPSHRVYILARR